MILAEKIMNLRKKCGWSQEELAEQLNISRQSVSKWESGASIPDLDKIVKMSGLFGVSTDYLLKDELEQITYSETDTVEESVRSISAEEADSYMKATKEYAKWLAPAISAFVLSPTPLILLAGLAECERIGMTEDVAGGIGVAILLIIIAIAAGIVIVQSLLYSKYEYLEKEVITLQYGVQGIVQKKKDEYEKTFVSSVAIGVVMIILGVVPLVVAGAFGASDMVCIVLVDVLLALISVACYLFVKTGVMYGCFEKLLQQGDYSEKNKEMNRKTSLFPGAYWCVVTAIFLGWGFFTEDWGRCGLIWPIAGVLYGALVCIVKATAASRSS